MASRNVQIDTTKGVAIVLMIIGHCSLFDGTIRYVIFSFHMPLFFIFSGYFFRNKPIIDVFKSGLSRLVKPYFIYAFLTELLFRLFWKKGFITCITDILFAHGGPKNTVLFPTETSLGPIWFLMALFWCRVFYAIIFKICKQHVYLSEIISFIVSFLAICVGKYYLNLPLGIFTGASALAFYGVGIILRDTQYRNMYAFVVVWLVAVYYHITYVDMVNFNYQFYPFDFICGIGGSLLIFFISWLVAMKTRIRLLAILGVYSLEILCVHQLVMCLCNIFGYNGWVFFLANISIPILLPFMCRKINLDK